MLILIRPKGSRARRPISTYAYSDRLSSLPLLAWRVAARISSDLIVRFGAQFAAIAVLGWVLNDPSLAGSDLSKDSLAVVGAIISFVAVVMSARAGRIRRAGGAKNDGRP